MSLRQRSSGRERGLREAIPLVRLAALSLVLAALFFVSSCARQPDGDGHLSGAGSGAAASGAPSPGSGAWSEPFPSGTGTNLLLFSRVDRAWQQSRGDGCLVAIADWMFDLGPGARAKYVHPASLVPGEEIGTMKPWHGEWMAEIVHAVAPGAKIIPIRARSSKDPDYQEFLVKAIHLAADRGAVAVTSSMGPTVQSAALARAIDYAEERGTIFVDVHPERVTGEDGDEQWCRPGECDARIVHAGVVSVPGHETRPDPARDVYTWAYALEAKWKDGWGYSNGPPLVGGVIALVKSVNPSLSPAEVREILADTSYDWNGFPVIDASAAVAAARAASR